MKKIISLVIWIAVYLAVAFGIGQITQGSIQGWYSELNKPSFNPPNYIFPIMWTFLYILIATAGWKIWQVGQNPMASVKDLKWLFIAYTILNWAWTPIFFGGHEILLALIWIIVLNIVTIIFILKAWNNVRFSAVCMILPLFWTLFAAYLNYSIYVLNV